MLSEFDRAHPTAASPSNMTGKSLPDMDSDGEPPDPVLIPKRGDVRDRPRGQSGFLDRLPTQSELIKSCRMKPSKDKAWCTEATPKYLLFLVINSGFLDDETSSSVAKVGIIADVMIRTIPTLKSIDPTPLLEARFDYECQQEIPVMRVGMLSALAIHYRLNFGLVVRCLAREYTGAHRDPVALEMEIGPHIEIGRAHV